MAIMLTRQINENEKKIILERFGKKCFATGHDISDDAEIQFDHIRPFADGGASEIDNIAPMCKNHNLKKGQLPLEDFRIKLKLEEFFAKGPALTLKDELAYLKDQKLINGFGQPCYSTINTNQIEIEVADKKTTHELFTCPTTQWKYFYALVPVDGINSDDDEDGKIGLQPRYLIFDKVFAMYRHFQKRPVLQPSIARLHENRILVFDGQHKIAAMLWGERTNFDLKVYIDPDPQVLNNTNIDAHDKFAQTRFYSSIMVAKLGSQFGRQFEDYKNKDDDREKSEAGFVEYLRVSEELTPAALNKRFNSFLYNMVLDPNENKLSHLVSKSNRSSDEYPLTSDMLSKSLFANFLYREPRKEDLLSKNYKRHEEIANVIRLFNILHEAALHGWNTKKDAKDQKQNRLTRILRSKSIMSWSEILKDAIAAKLDMHSRDEKDLLFYRELTEENFERIRGIVQRLLDWPIWVSPPGSPIDRILADNKRTIKEFMREHGLTTGYLMGAPE